MKKVMLMILLGTLLNACQTQIVANNNGVAGSVGHTFRW